MARFSEGRNMTYEEFRGEWERILTLPRSEREEALSKWMVLSETEVPDEYKFRLRKERDDKEYMGWRELQIIGDTRELREARLLLLGHHLDDGDENTIEKLWPEVVAQKAELWFFCSPSHTWKTLCGRAGFLIVKNGEVLKTEVTILN
jgi:hypothetical protein